MTQSDSKKKKDRFITVAITIVIVLLLGYNVFSYYGARITLPGKEISTVSGFDPVTGRKEKVDLSQGKVLVNFWATWCGACIKEMPYLNKVAEKHRVVGVLKGPAIGDIFSAADVKFENILAEESFFNDMMISVLPTSILVQNGVIKEVHVGIITESIISEWFDSK
jgi:thiol-disulfide isomerase/thioredoxin